MDDLADLYLQALKQALTRGPIPVRVRGTRPTSWKRRVFDPVQRVLARRGYRIVQTAQSSGSPWAQGPETLVTMERLDNIRSCIERVLADDVPGDLIETGVWRGGTVIFMRAVLAAHGVEERTVWAADSFQGFPRVRRYEIDRGQDVTAGFGDDFLSVDLPTVRENFDRYGLLDDRVRFLPGWFSETLVKAPIERLALLRLDGDLYESTWDAITVLEPKVSPGGFVIVDDYGDFEQCRRAVHDYRDKTGIDDPIEQLRDGAAFWRKSRS